MWIPSVACCWAVTRPQEMFGDSVTVTTVEGIPDSDDEEEVEAERLEKELIAEKKRARAERSSIRGRCGTKGAPIKGGEGERESRWSLAAVQKRLAANMPAKTRKGATRRANGGMGASGSEKGKKGSKHRKAVAGRRGLGAGAGASASALMDKARGSMPRAELGKSKGKKRKRG